MTLFEECIFALGYDVTVLSERETSHIFNLLNKTIPITPWGTCDWEKVTHHIRVNSLGEILEFLKGYYENFDTSVFILWDEASFPSIMVDLEKALEGIDDITAVSFDTWLFNPSLKYVIEFHHDNGITVGVGDKYE